MTFAPQVRKDDGVFTHSATEVKRRLTANISDQVISIFKSI